jgi:apolipoprotein N-acyltransferase
MDQIFRYQKNIVNLLWVFIVAPALTSFMLIYSFPGHDYPFLAWIAFVPFFLTFSKVSFGKAFCSGCLTGLWFSIGMTYPWWFEGFPYVSPITTALLYCYFSFFFILFSLFLVLLIKKGGASFLAAAPIWVIFEYLRGHVGFLSYPWPYLSITQYLQTSLIQMATITGGYGLSFLILLVNGAIADFLLHLIFHLQSNPAGILKGRNDSSRPLRKIWIQPSYRMVGVLLLLGFIWIVGVASIPSRSEGTSLSIAVVQGNIPQNIKWDKGYKDWIWSTYESLTLQASRSNPKLIVWPEAATPGHVLFNPGLLNQIGSLVQQTKSHLLLGSAEYPKLMPSLRKNLRTGNSAILFSPAGRPIGQYLKVRLIPFGEYVPLEDWVDWPEFIVSKDKARFHQAGNELVCFGLEKLKFGTLICWETFFPEMARSFVSKGAQFLVNISNEAWFGRSPVPYQVLAITVFRAVENRVNLVRCANTGVSGFIDPYGRVTRRVMVEGKDIFVPGIQYDSIVVNKPGTFYTRHGDLLIYVSLIYLLISVSGIFLKKKH